MKPEQIEIELHTPIDPWCKEPIATVYVGYVPRVGDHLWTEGGHRYQVIQVAQWAEDLKRSHGMAWGRGAPEPYLGRICAMVELAGV